MTLEINEASILVKSGNTIFDQFRMSVFNTTNWFGGSGLNENSNNLTEQEELIENTHKANINPYVKVTYAGITVNPKP